MEKLRSELDKIRKMSRRDALWYIWEYYKIHLMFLAIILFFVVLIIQANVINRQETVLSALLVDTNVTAETAAEFESAYAETLGLEPKRQKISIGVSTVEGGSVAALEKLIMSVAAGEEDALLCDMAMADYLLKSGALSDLEAVLPEELLSRCGGRLLYADADALSAWTEANHAGNAEETVLLSAEREGMSRPVPVCVDVTEACEALLGRPAGLGPVLFSVSVTTRRQEAAAAFLSYLLEKGGAA